MRLLRRPQRFIWDEFKTDVVLVYGTVEDGEIALYSTHRMPGYEKSGKVYRKALQITDPTVRENTGILTTKSAFLGQTINPVNGTVSFVKGRHPERDALKHLFGLADSFAYLSDKSIVELADREHLSFNIFMYDEEIPLEVQMAHEGAHAATSLYINELLYIPDILNEGITGEHALSAILEAPAYLMDFKYLMEFYPELEETYRMHMERPSPWDSIGHTEGFRLADEHPEIIQNTIDRIKKRHEKRNRKHVHRRKAKRR